VIALDPAEFAQWKTNYAMTPAATNGTAQVLGLTGDAVRGAAIFADAKKQCAACHIIEGTAAKGKIGPNLTHYGNRRTIAAGVLPYSPENLAKWLHDPASIKPGNLMGRVIKKGMLKDQEVADLVAYLDGMKFAVNMPAEK
jgi:cytochrome c oxidase subunit 2